MFDYLVVEFIGTFIFLYVIIATGNPYMIGLTLTLCALAGGAISGGHFNPAVSVMSALAGKIPMSKLLPYIAVQVFAGFVALHVYQYSILLNIY